jgi:mono/diheme cytochrome c family protein
MRMAGKLLAVAVSLAALTATACGGQQSKPEPGLGGDAAKGKEVFAGTCSSCHGPDGKGMPSLGKDLTKSTFADGLTDQQLLDFLKVGRPTSDPKNTTGVEMPTRGGNPSLTDQDLINTIAYLRSLSAAKQGKK